MDKLREKTDKELAKMEKKLGKIYEQAEKDIAEKWDEYMKAAAEKLEPLEKAYANAKESGDKELINETGKALGQEKYRQTIQNARFKDMLAETAEKISDVNAIALSYVNGEQAKVYSNNYNGTLKEIKSDIKGIATGVKFNMVDERTVRELVKKDKLLFSQKTLNRAKDRKWNLKALTSQVTQGILQGESVPNIAKRLAAVSDMNRTSCIRNARTMTTTSENSGRLAGMKEAEEKGIVYEKQWMATNDDRTRESHAELDGVSVPIDEPFPNGLMYPADMSGAPEEVYNCRCSMVRHLIGFRTEDGDVVDVGDIERYERRTPEAAKTEKPTEIAEEITAKETEKTEKPEENKKTEENKEPEASAEPVFAFEIGDTIQLPYYPEGKLIKINNDGTATLNVKGKEVIAQQSYIAKTNSKTETQTTPAAQIIIPETKTPPPMQDTEKVIEKLEKTAEADFTPIKNPMKFDDSKNASEYFRGQTYPSKMGGINNRRGYGIREEADKPATAWQNKLTLDQSNAIFEYTGNGYEPINNFLRGIWNEEEASDIFSGDQSLKKTIKNIDAGIKKFNLEKPLKVYRTCERDFLEQLQEGGVFHDDGYGSTTVLPITVASGDVHMEIDVPKGKGVGAYVDGVSWKEGEEFEFLLGRGADYKIEKIEEKEDGVYVKATVTGFTR